MIEKFANWLACLLFWHVLFIWQEFRGSRRVVCGCCRKSWGMHDETKSFIPWSGELEEMYQSFGFKIRDLS